MICRYAPPRLTKIEHDAGEFRIEDTIANECCLITVSHNGFIKRTRRICTVRRKGETRESLGLQNPFCVNGVSQKEKLFVVTAQSRATQGRSYCSLGVCK
jgi:DNA gyrase/topoisomerase IV subunit A